MRHHLCRGFRSIIQYGRSLCPSKSSRIAKSPRVGHGGFAPDGSFGFGATHGTRWPASVIIGQPSFQRTGIMNVSRPVLKLRPSYGRTPRNIAHQSPRCVLTKDAWPVDVIGFVRSGGRSRCVRIGLPANGT